MKIGNINIENPVTLAPMESITDQSFRLICKKLGADIMYTEFVSSEGLIRNVRKTKSKMLFLEEERPIGIQIYGSLESSMESAAKMAENMNPDFIDINAGCWVKKIVAQGSGAGLLKDLKTFEKVVKTVVNAVKLPVTVKTRLGLDEKDIRIVETAKIIENAGAVCLTVHCRTRTQAHKGSVDYSWIPKIKETVKIPIIINGGIVDHETAKMVFDTTGCDGIMIGQAAIHNPWIFKQIKSYINNSEILPAVSMSEKFNIMLEHLKLSVHHKGDVKGILDFRKYYSGYLHNFPNAAKIRSELMKFTELAPLEDEIMKIRCHLLNEN